MAANSQSQGLSVIQRAKAHFQDQPTKEIIVPEWGEDGEPFVCYAQPFTIQDQGKLQFAVRNGSESDALVEVLVLKCIDKDGNKIFQISDKPALRNSADAQVVARIANQIMGSPVEELEKN